MPNPTSGDVFISRPLTNVAISYTQAQTNFVADRIFPMVNVEQQGGSYWVFDKGDFLRDSAQKRAPSTESAGDGWRVSSANYFAEVWAIHKDIDDQIRANTQIAFNSDRDAAQFVTRKLLIKREALWTSTYFVTGVWGTSFTPSTLWSASSSTPIEDVWTAKRTLLVNTGYEPNTLTLGYDVYKALVNNAEIVDRVKYGQTASQPAMVTANVLAQLFEVDRVMVLRAISNTAAEGDTGTTAFMQGKHALLTYSPSSPSLMEPSAGYTFAWSGYIGSQGSGIRVKNIRIEERESDRIEASMAMDQKLVAADLGYFFESVVA